MQVRPPDIEPGDKLNGKVVKTVTVTTVIQTTVTYEDDTKEIFLGIGEDIEVNRVGE